MPEVPALATWSTRESRWSVDARGQWSDIRTRRDARALLAPGQPAPILQIRVGGAWYSPTTAQWNPRTRQLALGFDVASKRLDVRVLVAQKPTHIALELVDVEPAGRVECILWGPLPLAIAETVGEVVGVVRDGRSAVGIQALNPKTLGGYPNQENDIEPDYSADDSGVYPDLPESLRNGQQFRGDTARRTPWGSVLQAYCRDRSRPRTIENLGFPKYAAPAFDDGGVVGSRIALFAGPAARALDTIGAIELAEGLPHPMLDGTWAKQSREATASYLIVDFSEETLDRAVAMARRAGLRWLYHGSPFATWGTFQLKPDLFPHGVDGLRRCVDRAAAQGVRVGFHTLSNFITPNDPLASPKPHRGLAQVGSTAVPQGIDATTTEIPVEDPALFRPDSTLRTLRIGDELITWTGVSTNAPWRLIGCARGAHGTRPSPHPAGARAARLADHGYKVFLTDPALSVDVARRIAELCNRAGTRQISLDGLEGNWSTGMGQYGRTLFTTAWYDALRPELKGTINDASNPGHYNWHIATRMNWGEPWYAGFRESQTLYRFRNQFFYHRNLMPCMLGWFAVRPETTVEDARWLLARAAGFDAGFALATSLASTAQLEADPRSADAARTHGSLPAILDAIRIWEAARHARAFPEPIRPMLRDNTREFDLAEDGPGRWTLYPMAGGTRGKPIRLRAR